ncbi:hypothetical protein SNK04_007613 [Fusarium graminearum]
MTRPATRSITASTTTTTEVIDLTKKAAGGQFRALHTIYINFSALTYQLPDLVYLGV